MRWLNKNRIIVSESTNAVSVAMEMSEKEIRKAIRCDVMFIGNCAEGNIFFFDIHV
jgi:hypothetical protein